MCSDTLLVRVLTRKGTKSIFLLILLLTPVLCSTSKHSIYSNYNNSNSSSNHYSSSINNHCSIISKNSNLYRTSSNNSNSSDTHPNNPPPSIPKLVTLSLYKA